MSLLARLRSFLDDVKRIREALERLSPPNLKDPRKPIPPSWKKP